MRYWLGITDYDWFRFLAAKPELAEVNFWQPSASRRPAALEPGQLFLFKLHGPRGGWIVGGGFFVKYEAMPIRRSGTTAPSAERGLSNARAR
jgi:putative restriction endonuclease